MRVWFSNAYSRPFLEVFGAHFPRMISIIVLTPKRTVLGLKHVIWAIKREYRSHDSSWALCEKKGQDREKVTKGLYFTYLWRSPHWSDLHEKLFNRWCSQRHHVCQVSKWNFQGLRFYRGLNCPFCYWFMNGQSINKTLFAKFNFTNNHTKTWQAARTGNNPTKLAILGQKDRQT